MYTLQDQQLTGTPDSPVWIRGPSDGNVDIQLKVNLKGRYIFFENLNLNKDEKTLVLTDSDKFNTHHRGCTFTGEKNFWAGTNL